MQGPLRDVPMRHGPRTVHKVVSDLVSPRQKMLDGPRPSDLVVPRMNSLRWRRCLVTANAEVAWKTRSSWRAMAPSTMPGSRRPTSLRKPTRFTGTQRHSHSSHLVISAHGPVTLSFMCALLVDASWAQLVNHSLVDLAGLDHPLSNFNHDARCIAHKCSRLCSNTLFCQA